MTRVTRLARPFARLVLFCTVATASAGCLSVKEPVANFRGPTAGSVTPDGVVLAFDFNFHNPNAFYLPVLGADYRVSLGGVPVAKDQAHPDDAIPGYSQMLVTVPVRLSFSQLLPAEQVIIEGGGEVPYTFDGTVEFVASRSNDYPLPWPGRRVRVPLHYSGKVSLREALIEARDNPTVLRSPNARRFVEGVTGRLPPAAPTTAASASAQ